VELIDLYPTLAELAGLNGEMPDILQGASLAPFLVSPAAAGPDRAAYTISARGGASIRTDRWRYNRWGETPLGANEELYDHESDPREIRNLAADPRYRDVLADMRARLEDARRRAR
jgi:arylsulfatase A-like enzyme